MNSTLSKFKEQYPYQAPEFTEDMGKEALKRANDDCWKCFKCTDCDTKDEERYGFSFKKYRSVGGFEFKYYNELVEAYVENGSYPFDRFKSYHGTELKASEIKKKSDKEAALQQLHNQVRELGIKLAEFYHYYEYRVDLYQKWQDFAKVMYVKGSYLSSAEKEAKRDFLKEHAYEHMNDLDRTLIMHSLSDNGIETEERERIKKMLLDSGYVSFERDETESDGFTPHYMILTGVGKYGKPSSYSPKIPILARLKELKKLTHTGNGLGRTDWWYDESYYIKNLWYNDMGSKFAMENFLKCWGDKVPTIEKVVEDEDNLKDLIDGYENFMRNFGQHKMQSEYIDGNNIYPENTLFTNLINNHYGLTDEKYEELKRGFRAELNAERAKKGGCLRDSWKFYKLNSQGEVEYLQFYLDLTMERQIAERSRYTGTYEIKSGSTYTVKLTDGRTGIELPAFDLRVNSACNAVYLGNDKVPYKNAPENACLRNLDGREYWYSVDGKESFTHGGYDTEWKSSITGGISGSGYLITLSNTQYIFKITETSWGGKLEDPYIPITTDASCNVLYYGKGKKKFVRK